MIPALIVFAGLCLAAALFGLLTALRAALTQGEMFARLAEVQRQGYSRSAELAEAGWRREREALLLHLREVIAGMAPVPVPYSALGVGEEGFPPPLDPGASKLWRSEDDEIRDERADAARRAAEVDRMLADRGV